MELLLEREERVDGLVPSRKKKMQAVQLMGPREARLQECAIPEPGTGNVRIRLEGCGVCGSNLAPWEGRPWFKYPFNPGEPGHEGWGIVDAVGEGVTRIKPGARVAFLSYKSFAEYDVALEEAVVPLPKELDGQPFPGEALGCAFNVVRRCNIQPGQTVAVLGIGFLGAIVTALAVKAGAHVLAASRRPFALEIAKAYGAAEVMPFPSREAVAQRIMELTKGRGCDQVIEAVGNQEALDLATDVAAERGRLIIAGYHQDGMRQVNMQLWNWRGLDVINAHERETRIYVEGIQLAAEAIARGNFDPTPLYTHSYALDEVDIAFEAMRTRPDRFLKALVIL
ncbi:MAG: threonine dehydrogenase [Verrucomicrobiales bacterium]|nr:threonine dehydrogenase [Verrucomicrobiales bacterium]